MSFGRRVRSGGVVLVGLVALAAAAAPWIAPFDPDLQEDVAGARHLPPLTRAHRLQVEPHRAWIVTSLRRVESGWSFERGGRPGRIADADLAGPPERRIYLLGTDSLGRDLTSRLLFGARHSLRITLICVFLSLLAGIAVGGISALAGGWWDAAMMRGVDVLMSIPRVVIFLVCAAALAPSDTMLILALAATTWTDLARLVRGEVLSLREGEMVAAARAAGASPSRLLAAHLVPALGPVLSVTASLRFADTVLLESALSFLGLGSPPPAVSLGGIVASGRESLADAWWVPALPGLLIASIVVSLRSFVTRLLRLREGPSVW